MNPKQKQKVLKALDTLALALADHGHTWTNEQRRAYEQAVAAIKH